MSIQNQTLMSCNMSNIEFQWDWALNDFVHAPKGVSGTDLHWHWGLNDYVFATKDVKTTVYESYSILVKSAGQYQIVHTVDMHTNNRKERVRHIGTLNECRQILKEFADSKDATPFSVNRLMSGGNKTMNQKVQEELLKPLVFYRKLDEINDAQYRLIATAILQCCSNDTHPTLVDEATRLLIQLATPPDKRPPGAPGSLP